MSKKKLSPRKLQTVLIGDELLDANLANLVPASSKIGDSAATLTKVTASDINVTTVRVIQ